MYLFRLAIALLSLGVALWNDRAVAALPDEIPAFVRASAIVAFIGELGPELDRSKGAGASHDVDRRASASSPVGYQSVQLQDALSGHGALERRTIGSD